MTPQSVTLFTTMKPLPGERELKPKHLKFLEDHILNGTFYGPDWAEVLDLSTGEVYRADGQHSSAMLSQLPPDKFPPELTAYIAKYEISSLHEDAANLFNLFNNPVSARTNEDAMGVFTAPFEELKGITRKFCIRVLNGIAESIRISNEDAVENYAKIVKKLKKDDPQPAPPKLTKIPHAREIGMWYHDPQFRAFAVWLNALQTFNPKTASGETGKPVLNMFIFGLAGVVGRMYEDWRKRPEFATEFWANVLTEAHPDANDYSRELAVQLRKFKYESNRKTQHEYYRLACKTSSRAAAMHGHATAQQSIPGMTPPDTQPTAAA